MGCGSSTAVSQAPPAQPDEYGREGGGVSCSGTEDDEDGSSSSYDSYESGTEGDSGDDEGPEEADEVREQEPVVQPAAAKEPALSVASPTGSFKVRKTRQRRSSVELFKARQAEGEGTAAPRAPPVRLAEDGPDLDEGVAGLVDSWLQACVVGDAAKLWTLLAPAMQEQLAAEADTRHPPCTPQEWCVQKNSWHWPESRGRFLRMRVSSFDGHMCGIRSSYDTGLLKVDYRDVVWVRDGCITATKSNSLLTDDVRRQLAADLVEHAARGQEHKVWLALAPSMRAHYEQESEGRKLSAEQLCLQEHSWSSRRGEFEGQKMVSYDEATGTAVIHAYFRQGGVDQVAYRELFSLKSGMITARNTEYMATDWQKKTAATKLVEYIVAQDADNVWRALSQQLQEKYSERGQKKTPAMTGPEYCMYVHRWAHTRGHCTNIEVKSFEGKAVTIATTFNTHGSPNLAYRDTFFLVQGSALALSHTSDCLWTLEQARALIDAVAAAAALNELPVMYSHIEGPQPFTSPRARVDPTRGARWIYSICNERLQKEIGDQAEANGFVPVGGQPPHETTMQWCCRRFDWAGRTKANGCTIAGFRGFEVVHCDRTPGRADAYTARIRTLFDVGVTHVAVLVDELTVVAGMLDVHKRCTDEYEIIIRSPLPEPRELALVTGATFDIGFDALIEEVEYDLDNDGVRDRTSLDAVQTVVTFMETLGRGDLKAAWKMLSPKAQHAYGENKYADAARAAKAKDQADARAAQARLVAMEARGGDEATMAKLREAVEADRRQAESTDGVSEGAFQRAMAWRGPRILEVGTKFEHVMRLHENGKRGSEMGDVTVVDFDPIDRTARVHCKWEPTNAVYEDSVTICRHTGKIASFEPLGLATPESVEEGLRIQSSQAFVPRMMVFAPKLPAAEDGVMCQASTQVSLNLAKGVDMRASIGYENIEGVRKFKACYLYRNALSSLTVHHDVTLQELRLVMRDSIPQKFQSVAGGAPSLTPDERSACLADTMFSFDDVRAFLDAAEAWRMDGEPDFGYAVRLRDILCAAILANRPAGLANAHLQHCFDAPEIKKLFAELDKDHSGFLNADEVRDLATKLGTTLSDEALSAAMAEMDPSGDGKVDLHEFSTWWRREMGEGMDGIHHMACCELYVNALRLNQIPTRVLVCMAKPPEEKRKLPAGWKKKVAPDSGDEFFLHEKTGRCTFDKPDGGERFWYLLEYRQYTASMFIEGVGWVTTDVLNSDPSSFGLGLADAVVWSAQPALSSMRADMALLRPGFEAGAACDRLFQDYDVDESGTLSSSGTKPYLLPACLAPSLPLSLSRCLTAATRSTASELHLCDSQRSVSCLRKSLACHAWLLITSNTLSSSLITRAMVWSPARSCLSRYWSKDPSGTCLLDCLHMTCARRLRCSVSVANAAAFRCQHSMPSLVADCVMLVG